MALLVLAAAATRTTTTTTRTSSSEAARALWPVRWSADVGGDVCVSVTEADSRLPSAPLARIECLDAAGRVRAEQELSAPCAPSPCRVRERVRVRVAGERVNPEAEAGEVVQLLFPRHVCARPSVHASGDTVRIEWPADDVERRAHVHQWIVAGDHPPVRAPADGRPIALRLPPPSSNASSLTVHIFDAVYESCPSLRWQIEPARFDAYTRGANASTLGADGRGYETWSLATAGEALPAPQRWALAVLGVALWAAAFSGHATAAGGQPLCMTAFGLATVVLWEHMLTLTLVAAAACVATHQLAPLAVEAARGRVRFPTKARMSEIRSMLAWNAWTVLAAVVVHAVL